MLDRLLSIVAPHSCCGCGMNGNILCVHCEYDIVGEVDDRCLSCAVPTAYDNLCDRCQRTTGMSAAWFVGAREGTMKRLLDRYKFDSAIAASGVCVDMLHKRLPVVPETISVTAVPTAGSHMRERGFDHTERIARMLAKRRGLVFVRTLERHGSATQHFKSKQERIADASKNLIVRQDIPKDILLIDDIYTTGATVHACVDKLRSAGADNIYVAVVARQDLS